MHHETGLCPKKSARRSSRTHTTSGLHRCGHETDQHDESDGGGRPFFDGLVEFMTSGACVPVALEKDNAVADYRTLIGTTDPKDAAPGTIRKDFADNKGENIVHGSDSAENGIIEVSYFFAQTELL
jgi:nucleoside diphosphate kinase